MADDDKYSGSMLGDLSRLFAKHYIEAVERTMAATSPYWEKLAGQDWTWLEDARRAGLLVEATTMTVDVDAPYGQVFMTPSDVRPPTWQFLPKATRCHYCSEPTFGLYKGRTPRHAHNCELMRRSVDTWNSHRRDEEGVDNRSARRHRGVRLSQQDNVDRIGRMGGRERAADLAFYLFFERQRGAARPTWGYNYDD